MKNARYRRYSIVIALLLVPTIILSCVNLFVSMKQIEYRDKAKIDLFEGIDKIVSSVASKEMLVSTVTDKIEVNWDNSIYKNYIELGEIDVNITDISTDTEVTVVVDIGEPKKTDRWLADTIIGYVDGVDGDTIDVTYTLIEE